MSQIKSGQDVGSKKLGFAPPRINVGLMDRDNYTRCPFRSDDVSFFSFSLFLSFDRHHNLTGNMAHA